MEKRAWLFCRVGGGHEHDGKEILAQQERQLLDYCAEQGLRVAGSTAAMGTGREELEKLVDEGITHDSFDVLVSASTSRLGRNIMDVLSTARKLEENGIGLCLVKEGICTMPVHENDMEMGGLAL